MNSRQAINLLKGLEQSLDDYCELNDEGKAAFRMAITALEVFGNSEPLPSAQPERQINLDGFETPIEILSALRSQFNCFDEQEEKAYHALSEAIHALSAQSERTSPCADCQEFDCYGCDERENRYE